MRVFIAIAIIAALTAVAAKIYQGAARELERRVKGTGGADEGRRAAQALVPAHGFEGHCLVTTYGERVVAFEVEGPNLSLSTAEEKDAQIARLAAALSGESSCYTIYRMIAPVDDTAQVRELRRQLSLIDAEEAELSEAIASAGGKADYQVKKRLAAIRQRRDYIERAYLPQYGEAEVSYRSRSYVVMAVKGGDKALEAAMKAADDFMVRLVTAGYHAHLLNHEEMIRFLVNCNGRFPSSEEVLVSGKCAADGVKA